MLAIALDLDIDLLPRIQKPIRPFDLDLDESGNRGPASSINILRYLFLISVSFCFPK